MSLGTGYIASTTSYYWLSSEESPEVVIQPGVSADVQYIVCKDLCGWYLTFKCRVIAAKCDYTWSKCRVCCTSTAFAFVVWSMRSTSDRSKQGGTLLSLALIRPMGYLSSLDMALFNQINYNTTTSPAQINESIVSSNRRSILLFKLSHLIVLCSDANQNSRLCNSSCHGRAPTSNITPLVNATTGEDIQNFPVTVAAIQTMNGMILWTMSLFLSAVSWYSRRLQLRKPTVSWGL